MKKIEINNENWYWWVIAFIEIWWVKYTIIHFDYLYQLLTVNDVNGRNIGDGLWAAAGICNLLGSILLIVSLYVYLEDNGIPEFKLTLWKSKRVEDEDNLSK